MSEKLYGICENKCLKEVVPKEEIDLVPKETKIYTDSAGNTIKAIFRRSGKVVTVDMQIDLVAKGSLILNSTKLLAPDFAKYSYSEDSLSRDRGQTYAFNNMNVSNFQPFTMSYLHFRSFPNGNVAVVGNIMNGCSSETTVFCTSTYIVD